MLTMYSKLFNAGLSITNTLPRDCPCAPATSSRKRRNSSRSSSWPTMSDPPVFSPTSLEIASPSSTYPSDTTSAIYFTLRPKKSDDGLRSFLSLDLAESVRSKSYSQRLSSRRNASTFILPSPKPAPSILSILPSPPLMSPSSAATTAGSLETTEPRTPPPAYHTHARKISVGTTATELTTRPSVKRANRSQALATLEGRHKRSFWDVDDDDDDERDGDDHHEEEEEENHSTPPTPLQDVPVNLPGLPALPIVGSTRRRKQTSTIESWFVPSIHIMEYLNEVDTAFSSPNEEESKEDAKDRRDQWRRVVGANLALVS